MKTKDPIEYLRKLRFHRGVKSDRDYGLGRDMAERPKVVIHTDGACSGNPGPGGWGAILAIRHASQGAERRRGSSPPTTAWS